LAPTGVTPEQAINRGYLTALGRAADSEELALSAAFIARSTELYQAAGKTDAAELATADFCQVLLGMNEFIYID
jgi:hypothetical protein